LGTNLALAATTAVTGIVTARLLGPEGRGQLATILLWPSALITLVGWGLPEAFTYFSGRSSGRLGALTRLALACAAVQGALVFLAALLLFPFLLAKQGTGVIALALGVALSAPVWIASTYLQAILQGCNAIQAWNCSRLMGPAIQALGVALLAVAGSRTLAGTVAVVALGNLVALLGALRALGRMADRSQPAAWDLLRPVTGYGSRILPATASSFASSRMDLMMMTCFLSPAQIGYYVAAASLTRVLTAPSQAFGSVMLPQVTRAPGSAAAGVLIRGVVQRTLGVIVPIVGLMYLAMPALLTRLYGEDFRHGALTARILLLAIVALSTKEILHNALRGLNRPLGCSLAEVAGAVISLAAQWLLLPKLQQVGAALASSLGAVASLGVLVYYVQWTLAKRCHVERIPV
jgi:O-antigen/teichoic acid export membrane protein